MKKSNPSRWQFHELSGTAAVGWNITVAAAGTYGINCTYNLRSDA